MSYIEAYIDNGERVGRADTQFRAFYYTFALSLICHILIGGGIIFLTERLSTHRYIPSAISVSVVGFPDELPGAAPSAPDIGNQLPEPPLTQSFDTIPEADREPITEPEPIPEIMPQPKAPEKTVVIPEPIQPIEKKPEPIEKKPEPPVKPKEKPESLKPKEKPANPDIKPGERSQSVSDAVNRIRKKLESEQSYTGPGSGAGTGAVGIGAGSGTPYGRFDSAAITFYRQNILRDWIQRNWVFPEHLAGKNAQLQTILLVKIMPSGDVADIRFDKKSGNSFLDESAYRAVAKSHPFPPLPKSFTEPYYIVAVGFTPKGLE